MRLSAKEHGYKPDLLARSLAKGKTYTIGMVVLDSKNRYFAQMISAVSAEAEKLGYGVNINLHNNNPQKEMDKLKRMAAYKMDGIILSSINEGEEYRKFLAELGVPIVSVDNMIAEGIPFVDISQRKAMRAATEKVLEAGYTNLVFVCPPIEGNRDENTYVHKKRLEGFEQAVEKHKGKVETTLLLDWDFAKVIASMEITNKTAFVCTSDELALDIMMQLREQGYEAGKDYGLHGFDDIDTLRYISPRLNSVNNNVEMVAKEAIQFLFQLIEGKETDKDKRIIVPYELVDGETL